MRRGADTGYGIAHCRNMKDCTELSQGAIAALLACLVGAAPAAARQHERRGFEPLTFGQSIAQVQTLYPQMRQLDREQLGATVLYHPQIQRYHQPDVQLAGLPQAVSLELRFWKGQLWVVIGYFAADATEAILAFLEQRYGKPSSTQPGPTWVGKKITIVAAPEQQWFSVSDNTIGQEVQALFREGWD